MRTPLQGLNGRTTTVKKVARGDGPQLGGARAGIDIPSCSSTPAARLGSVTKATSSIRPSHFSQGSTSTSRVRLSSLGPAAKLVTS